MTTKSRASSATLVALLTLVAATAATAGPNLGVKYVRFHPFQTECVSGQPLPCAPEQGEGLSNVIQVTQTQVGEEWVYDQISVPGIPDGELWISGRFGGKCRATYRPTHAQIDTGHYEYQGMNFAAEVDGWGGWFVDFDPSSRLIQDHEVDMRVPYEGVFENELGSQPPALIGFPSADSILEYGEYLVANEMAAEGISESAARNRTYEVQTHLEMHAWMRCQSVVWRSFAYFKVVPQSIPVTIRFAPKNVSAGQQIEPVDPPEAGPGVLVGETAVTQAFLSVTLDPRNSCRLRLSGVLVANAPTQVQYRILDELGHASAQVFTAEIDHTLSTLVDHYVDLPVLEGESGGGLVARPGGSTTGDKVAQPTDREQGTYQIAGDVPHAFESNVAGFNVEPCRSSGRMVVSRSETARRR